MSARRAKWHSPHPPTPRILHLPRRSSLFWTAKPRYKSPVAGTRNLGVHVLRENCRFWGDARKAEVESPSSTCEIKDSSEDRWRFQVDILRAECSFLRMEREVALRKLERNRAQMESAFSSAVETMISGRMKLGTGGSASMDLDEEIVELQAKLEKIQRDFRWRRCNVDRSGENFDRRASVLRRRVKGIREIAEITEPESSKPVVKEIDNEQVEVPSDRQCRFPDVERLRYKMEGLSRGMRGKMEEHGMLFRFFNYGAATAGGNSRRLPLREADDFGLETEKIGLVRCCKCKELVEKIVAQVMAEADQWAEMQAMLEKVKIDMEELRSSRDQWERRAISSELNLRSLHSQIREWKKRAIDSEKEAAEIRNRIAQASAVAVSSAPPALSDQLRSEICKLKQLKFREKQQKSFQAAKEKHVVGCRLIGSKSVDGFPRRRPPLQETVNLPHRGVHREDVWVTRGARR